MAFCPVERSIGVPAIAESPSAATRLVQWMLCTKIELFQFHEQVGVYFG